MASRFLSTHRISITPLSPIHIGCGDTYEPTNYVIDRQRGFLYGFDPSDAVLSPGEMTALRAAVRSVDTKKINLYYESHIDVFRPWARVVVPLGAKAEKRYQKMMHPVGNEKNTQFEVNRTIWSSRGGRVLPYIPGSSLKGVIVTALENRLNQRNYVDTKRRQQPSKLLGGEFECSPMRLLRVGDCHADDAKTRAFFTARYFKEDHSRDSIEDTFEAIVPAQYRAFNGEISLMPGQNPGNIFNVYEKAEDVLKDLHAYTFERWFAEQGQYALYSPDWTRQIALLLKAMAPLFVSGRAALVRLGKNTGAESKTLHGLNQPEIEIRRKKRDPKTGRYMKETLDHSTTAWYTDEAESAFNGLPYGWAIVELDPEADCSALETWCEDTHAQWINAHKGGSVNDEWDRVLTERQAKVAVREAMLAEARELEARREAEEAELVAKAQALASMSPEQREATELCDAIEAAVGTINPGTELFNRAKALLEKAVEWTDPQVKMDFAVRLQPLMKKKNLFQGKAEKLFKKQLRTLRGEA